MSWGALGISRNRRLKFIIHESVDRDHFLDWTHPIVRTLIPNKIHYSNAQPLQTYHTRSKLLGDSCEIEEALSHFSLQRQEGWNLST